MKKLLTLLICLSSSLAFSQYNWMKWDTFPGQSYQYRPDVTIIGNNAYTYAKCQLNNAWVKGVKYNPITKIWTPLPTNPTSNRFTAISFHYNGYIYRGFGEDSIGDFYNDLWKLDTLGTTWLPAGEIPDTNIGGGFTFQINHRVFLGGCNLSDTVTNTTYQQAGTPIWEYNTANSTFTRIATYPKHSIGMFIFNNGSRLFIGGGVTSGLSTYPSTYEYDVPNNTWIEKAPLPGWVSYSPGGYYTRGNYGYMYCGNGQDSTGFSVAKPHMLRYDMIGDQWAVVDTFPFEFDIPMYHMDFGEGTDPYFCSLVEDNTFPNVFNSVLYRYTTHAPTDVPIAYAEKNGLLAYPNPAPSGTAFTLMLPFEANNCTYMLHDITGKEYLFSVDNVDAHSVKIRPQNNLAKGIYFLRVTHQNKVLPVKLFVD